MSRLLPAVAIAALFASSAAFAQTTTPSDAPTTNPSAPSVTTTPPSTTAPAERAPPSAGTTMGSTAADHTMTDAEAKTWVDKAVYSSDDKHVGDVAAIQRDATGKVTSIQADIGGFLGLGSTRVEIMPSQFKLSGDRVVLDMPADQAKQLPTVEAK
ncbi:MAG: PRC-barrel domain-containing protein [Hyphomicrobiaceae bacterium]